MRLTTAILLAALVACNSHAPSSTEPRDAPAGSIVDAGLAADSRAETALARVTAIHGAPGPWAVLGYRMGDSALTTLGLARGSFDLGIVHHTPEKVQYSCIADGASAATGASAGKLNLKLEPATEDTVFTEYVNKKTGAKLRLRPTAAFRTRFAEAPREKAHENGLLVMQLPEAELFEPAP